jgi:quercetin dioxygenase-like cupin family protein
MSKTKILLLMLATALVSAGATVAVQEQRTRREPQFENEHVKAWKSIILPNQPLRLHRHENGRALIALTDGTLKVVNEAGETVDTYEWEAGKAYWLDEDPPDVLHGDLNEGPETIEVIVVELKN